MNEPEQPASPVTDSARDTAEEPAPSPVQNGEATGYSQPLMAERAPTSQATVGRPSFLFFGVVSAVSLLADVASKAWAELVLTRRTMLDPAIVLIKNHLSLTL